jgi:hypothetical protein
MDPMNDLTFRPGHGLHQLGVTRSPGGAGTSDGGAAAWPNPDFLLAKERAIYLVPRRGDDARGLVGQ